MSVMRSSDGTAIDLLRLDGLFIDGGAPGGGWSVTAEGGGFLGIGPEGCTLPPGTVIRALEGGGFRIEGPRCFEDQSARGALESVTLEDSFPGMAPGDAGWYVEADGEPS